MIQKSKDEGKRTNIGSIKSGKGLKIEKQRCRKKGVEKPGGSENYSEARQE